MKKLVLISFVVLLVMGLSASSYAVAKKKPMKCDMPACSSCECDGSPMERLQALGLDDKQTDAVQAIHFRTKKEMLKKKAEVEVAEVELRELIGKDTVDLQAAEAIVKKLEALKSDMKILHIKTREEVKALLTPEQKKKFGSMMGMGMGHGKGMHRGCDMQGMGGRDEMGCDNCPKQDCEKHQMRHRHK